MPATDVHLWALLDVQALTPGELEAHMLIREEPEKGAKEAQADATAAEKIKDV